MQIPASLRSLSMSFRDLSRVPRTVSGCYQHHFLVQDLPRLALDPNPKAVMDEQAATYAEVTRREAPFGFRVAIGKRGEPGTSLATGVNRAVYDSHLDWMSRRGPTLMTNVTKAHEGSTFISGQFPANVSDEWADYVDTTWSRHDVSTVAVTNYSVPFRANTRLMFASYFTQKAKDVASRFEFDIVMLPFAIVWLYRFGIIDEPILRHWLFMLSGLSPTKLFLIRELVTTPRYHATSVMSRTGLSKRNIENHLYQLSDILNAKVPRDAEVKGNGAILFDVVNNFSFLANFGRPAFQVLEGESSAAKGAVKTP